MFGFGWIKVGPKNYVFTITYSTVVTDTIKYGKSNIGMAGIADLESIWWTSTDSNGVSVIVEDRT